MRKIKNHIRTYAFIIACAALLTGCEADPIAVEDGSIPGAGGGPLTELPATGRLRTDGAGGVMPAYKVEDTSIDIPLRIYLDSPLSEDVTVSVSMDPEILGSKFTNIGSVTKEEIIFPAGETLTVKAGETASDIITIRVTPFNLWPGIGRFVPVTITEFEGNADFTSSDELYVVIFTEWPEEYALEKDCKFITYVDTEKVKPEIASLFGLMVIDFSDFGMYYAEYLIDIVNLNVAQVFVDENENRPLLNFDEDILYVLTNRDKYIVPVQDKGLDVCLVVKGGNKGIGFSNLTDTQVEDLAFQIASAVSAYNLDGVNLWDENAGYGREGTPSVNLTSYPKLIKSLRARMPGKLITVVDVGETTAAFAEAHGGIAVGELIDYAWHGYPDEIVDPWNGDMERKPILGLDRSRYSAMYKSYDRNYDLDMSEYAKKVRNTGLNGLYVFGNMPSFYQGGEGLAGSILNFGTEAHYNMEEGFMASPTGDNWSIGGYANNIWAKDW